MAIVLSSIELLRKFLGAPVGTTIKCNSRYHCNTIVIVVNTPDPCVEISEKVAFPLPSVLTAMRLIV